MKYLLIIPLILILLASCKKKQTIEVRVINPVTGEGYSNLGVQIEACRSGAFEDKCKVVYTGYTNESGNLLIETRLNTRWRHTIYADLPEDYCYSNGISEPIFDNESDNHEFTFERAPCAFLKLKIENVNCQGLSDEFDMDMRPIYADDYTAFGFTPKQGCYSNEFNQDQVPSGQWLLEWWVTRGATTYYSDTIYLDQGQVKTYEINY